MKDPQEGTVEEEVADIRMGRPHVAILGAGASRAALPDGDANDRTLPLMSDLVKVLDLEATLASWGIDAKQNFEAIFSNLYEQGQTEKIEKIQKVIEDYFGQLKLPDTPTIYDHLVLSLRSKDLIATFNWDPLLIQAYKRNLNAGLSLPRLAFLHGNVASGYCAKDKVHGDPNRPCSRCGEPFVRTPLLYPIHRKDYANDESIAAAWSVLRNMLKQAFMITVFGYSGPKTDAEAISTMSAAWGPSESRSMEQTAFITIQNEDEVAENWNRFIHSHHYEIHSNFHESWIANHPRRTGEAYLSQYLDAKFIEDHPIPKNVPLPILWHWFQVFKDAENKAPPSL